MRIAVAAVAVALAALACGNDSNTNPTRERAPTVPAEAPAPPPIEVTLPALELEGVAWDACGDYGGRIGSWVNELRAALSSGRSPRRLSAFATELSARLGGVKPAVEPLAAAHQVLVAAVTDLGEALDELAAAIERHDDAAVRAAMTRLENGVDNIELAAQHVVKACG